MQISHKLETYCMNLYQCFKLFQCTNVVFLLSCLKLLQFMNVFTFCARCTNLYVYYWGVRLRTYCIILSLYSHFICYLVLHVTIFLVYFARINSNNQKFISRNSIGYWTTSSTNKSSCGQRTSKKFDRYHVALQRIFQRGFSPENICC